MLSLLVISIVVIGMIALAGYTALSVQQSASLVGAAQQNVATMRMLAGVIESNLKAVHLDGVQYPPAGTLTSAEFTGIPAWLITDAKTPWGVPYLYCGYAPNAPIASGSGSVVEGDAETSYPINTQSNLATGGRDYIVGSAPPPVEGVLALIVSPDPNSGNMPNCADVTFAQGRFSVAQGSVAAVTRGDSHAARTEAARSRIDYFVAPAGNGNQSGTDPSNAMALENALSTWQAVKPDHMTVTLSAGTYTVTDATINFSAMAASEAEHQTLVIKGQGSSTILQPPTGNLSTFHIPGVTLQLRDFVLGTGTDLLASESRLFLENLTVPRIRLHQTQARLKGAITLTAPVQAIWPFELVNSAAKLNAATLTITGNSTALGAVRAAGSEITADNASSINLIVGQARPAVYLTDKSELNLFGAQLTGAGTALSNPQSILNIGIGASLRAVNAQITGENRPSAAIINAGFVHLAGTSVSLPQSADLGVLLETGSTTILENSTSIGLSSAQRPDIGVFDNGGLSLAGQTASVFGASCWSPVGLFSSSEDIPDGSSAPVTGASDAINILNRSNWTCKR